MKQGASGVRIHFIKRFQNHLDTGFALGLILWFGYSLHSYRRTSTGVMRVAFRAG